MRQGLPSGELRDEPFGQQALKGGRQIFCLTRSRRDDQLNPFNPTGKGGYEDRRDRTWCTDLE
jgi:hypothetical protein